MEFLMKTILIIQILIEIFQDYMGRNLVTDFDGKTAVKWGLSVSQHLFTENEIRLGTLLPSTRTNREALSPTRVKLLKSAFNSKYQFTPPLASKWFAAIRDSINTKGRNLKAKFKSINLKK